MGIKSLAFNIVTVILFSVLHFSAAGQGSIEITPIDRTGLFTGLWYTIELKSNNGRLSWADTIIQQSAVKANHVQVVFDVAVVDFQPGETFYNDTQWMFGPSEKSGLYFIYNKGIPHAVFSWAGGDSEKKYVALDQNFGDPDYKEGGRYRNDTLWSIKLQTGASGAQYYNIFNFGFPNSESGIMTISDRGIAIGKKHVEVYVSKNGDKGGSAEYLWKITPSYPIDASALTEQLSTLKRREQYLCARLDKNKAQ